jgi:hypothetical protein
MAANSDATSEFPLCWLFVMLCYICLSCRNRVAVSFSSGLIMKCSSMQKE